MDVGQLKKALKGLKDSDQVIFWEWREDDKETRSYFWDLQPTMNPTQHKGYFMLAINHYADEIKFKSKK